MRSRAKFHRYAPLLSLLYVLLLDPAIVTSAPVTVEESAYEVEGGCYYMLDLYKDGEQIRTNEPCLNCTCANSMLMCYLKTCPFSKPIGSECSVERVAGQCCPIIKCPEVPVMIPEVPFMPIGKPETTAVVQMTSTTAVSIPEPEDGCFVDGIFFTEGSQVPQRSDDPCDLCYCIHNHTACVKQRCTLEIPGCLPKYKEGACCPVSYDCDATVTFEPTTTTTTLPPSGCYVDDEYYYDGSVVHTGGPCEHCYCMQGKLVCAVQECDPPMEKCTPVFGEDQCCPAKYECPVTPAPVFNSTESYFESTVASVDDDSTESHESSVAPGHEVESRPPNDSTYTTKQASVFESTTESYSDNEVTDAPYSQKPLNDSAPESHTIEAHPAVEKFTTESPDPVLTELYNATELPSEVRQGDSTEDVTGDRPTEGPSATVSNGTKAQALVTTPDGPSLDEATTDRSKQATSQRPSDIPPTERDILVTESGIVDHTQAADIYNASGKPAVDGESTSPEEVATSSDSSDEQDDVLTTVPPPPIDDRTTASVGYDASGDKVTAAPEDVLKNETREESDDATTESSHDQDSDSAKTEEDEPHAATKSPDLAPFDEEQENLPVSTTEVDLSSTEGQESESTPLHNETVQAVQDESSEAPQKNIVPSSESPLYNQQPSDAPDSSEQAPQEYQTTEQPSDESKHTRPAEYKPTESNAEQYKSTEPPTEHHKPTEHLAEGDKPSEQSQQDHAQTELPAEQYKPTEPPSEEPRPSEQSSQSYTPTEQPSEGPKQTEQPVLEYKPTVLSEEGKSTEQPSQYKPTEQPAVEANETEQPLEVYSPTVQPTEERIATEKPLHQAKPTEQPLDESEQTEQTSDVPRSTAQPLDDLPMGDQPSESSESSEETTEQLEEKHKPSKQPSEIHPTDAPYVTPVDDQSPEAPTEGPTEFPTVNRDQTQAVEATTDSSGGESKEGSEEIGHLKPNASSSAATEAPLLDTTARQEDIESVPGEGDCSYHDITYHSGQLIPSGDVCSENCTCLNSIVKCDKITCGIPEALRNLTCAEVFEEGHCCPRYICSASSENDKAPPSSGSLVTALPLGTSEKPGAEASTAQPAISQSDAQLGTKTPVYDDLTTLPAPSDSPDAPEATKLEVRTEATVAEAVEAAVATTRVNEPEKSSTTSVPVHQGDDVATEANIPEVFAAQTTAAAAESDPAQVTTGLPLVVEDAGSTDRTEEKVNEDGSSRTTILPATDEDEGTKLPPAATEQPAEEESSLGPVFSHDSSTAATLPSDEAELGEGYTAQTEEKTKGPSSTAKEEEIATATEGLYSAKPQPTAAVVLQEEKIATTEVPVTAIVQDQLSSVSVLGSEDKERIGTIALPELTTRLPVTHDAEVTTQNPEIATASPMGETKPANQGSSALDESGEPEELTTVYNIDGEYHRATTHLSVSVEVENETQVSETGSVEYLDVTQKPQSSVTQHPKVDATQQPQQDATQQSQADATGQPQANETQQPQADATQEPETVATQQPEADATQQPQPDATQPPQADASQPPKDDATQPPQVDATQPPQDDATRPPQVDATQPPQADATQPPKDDATQPPQADSTQPPQDDATQPPQDDATQPPQDDVTQPPQDDATQPPQDDATQPPQDDATQRPQDDATQPPQADVTQTPQADATQPPQGDATQPPQADATQPPQDDITQPTQDDITQPTQDDTTQPPQADATQPPQDDVTQPPQADSTQPPQADVTQPPQDDVTQPPQADSTQPPQADATQPPQVDATQPPQEDATQPPQADTTQPPQADATQPPQADTTQPPQANTTQPPQADVTQPPQADTTQPPQANTTQPPQADVTQPPQADTTQPPQADATQPPQADATQPPQADATQPPQADATQPPQADATQPPQADATQPPQADATQPPQADATQPPQADATLQPQVDVTVPPQEYTTEKSLEDASQQSQDDATQQLITEYTTQKQHHTTRQPQDATQLPQEDATQQPQQEITQGLQADATQQPTPDVTQRQQEVGTQKPLYDATQQPQADVTVTVSKTTFFPDVPETKTEAVVPEAPQDVVHETTPAELQADGQEITHVAPVSDAQQTTVAAPQGDQQKSTHGHETTPAAPHQTTSPVPQADTYQTTSGVQQQHSLTTDKPQREEIATTQPQLPTGDAAMTTAIPDVTLFQLLTTTGFSVPHVTDTLATTLHQAITHKVGEVTEAPVQQPQNATAHPDQRPPHSPEPSTALPTTVHVPTTPETPTPGHLPDDGYQPTDTLTDVGIPITDANFTLEEGECIYDSRIYASAQQIPRDDPCDFCFCFRGDIICLQQSCPPPIDGCHEEAIPGFCCPRYECPVTAVTLNVTDTKMPYPVGASRFRTVRALTQAQVVVCEFRHKFYDRGEFIAAASGPCMDCICGDKGAMKCIPKKCQLGPFWQALPGFKKMGKPTATRGARNQF